MYIYVVDAFTDTPFTGNPAGVCILEENIDDKLMLNIAKEVNHSETAFALKSGDSYYLRWFTPKTEVALCGHATLAAAHILWEQGYESKDHAILFATKDSGTLAVNYVDDMIVMDFPQKCVTPTENNEIIQRSLGITHPLFIGCDDLRYLLEVEDEQIVQELAPDFEILRRLDKRVIVTARVFDDDDYDFVSRMFAPCVGVNEDPVTGTAHCYLAPYWAKKLQKNTLLGYQASHRPGVILCELINDSRVLLKGGATTVIKGEIILDSPDETRE